MTLELVKSATFAIDVGAIEAKREAFAALVCDSPSGYEAVRLAIAECRDTRVAIEGRRKELKADALEYGRQVDSVAKQLTSIVESIEDPLRWKKAAADEAKAKAKAERERVERERVEAELRAEREAQEAIAKAQREAEEARLRAERQAEEERLAVEREAQRVEREKLAAERAEMEARKAEEQRRIDTERHEMEARRAAEQARIDAERAVVEAERQKVARAQAALEQAEAMRVAEAKAREEERARVERERVEAEEIKARQAEIAAGIAARLEAVKPDVDKMREFAAMLRGLPTPTVRSDEATDVAILALARVAEAASIVEMWIASC